MAIAMTRELMNSKLNVPVTAASGAALSYAIASTIIISGFWWPEFLAFSAICYVLAVREQDRRPKMLVLRRFGDQYVETFLGNVAAGLGSFVRPIWLYDDRSNPWVRKHLPAVWLYLARTIVWVVFAWVIIGRVPGNLAREVLWVGWMIIASVVYHRYKAGHSPSNWIACVGAAITLLFLISFQLVPVLPKSNATWVDATKVVVYFVSLWAALAFILAVTPLKSAFSWMYRKRVVETTKDLDSFVRELREIVLFPRYVPVAPIQVAEIVCTSETWGAAVYESIGACSVVLADVSNINDAAAITWELRQAALAGVPMFLTCEEGAAPEARRILIRLGNPEASLFIWRRNDDAELGIAFDTDELTTAFYRLIEGHQLLEFRYLPLRPTRDEALAELRSIVESEPQRCEGS